jgi:hypothetical protein
MQRIAARCIKLQNEATCQSDSEGCTQTPGSEVPRRPGSPRATLTQPVSLKSEKRSHGRQSDRARRRVQNEATDIGNAALGSAGSKMQNEAKLGADLLQPRDATRFTECLAMRKI